MIAKSLFTCSETVALRGILLKGDRVQLFSSECFRSNYNEVFTYAKVLWLQTLPNVGECNEDSTTFLNPYSCFQVTWNCFSYF